MHFISVGDPVAGDFAAPRFYDLEKGIDLSLSGETSHTADGTMAYFHSVRPTNTGYQQKPPTNDILDIYAAKVVNGEPQAGINLGAPINSPRGESQSAFAFNDLKTMYFTSDRDPKIGVAIYRSTQQKDSSWSEPEWVIKGIVGEPTLTADGSLLYFAHVLTDAKGIFDADFTTFSASPFPQLLLQAAEDKEAPFPRGLTDTDLLLPETNASPAPLHSSKVSATV